MSVFAAYILDGGIVFAADKNITYDDGTKTWQQTGTKVFRSPSGDAVVGYVGAAETASKTSMESLLSDFLANHTPVSSPSAVAAELQKMLQAEMAPGEASIVQFAAFGDHAGLRLPEYWHISNVHGMNTTTGGYDPPGPSFGCSEELLSKFRAAGVADSELRGQLRYLATSYNPSWFHQSIDLAIFNGLEDGAKASLRVLQAQGFVPGPVSLTDWEKHAKYWVLLYGAYYSAFHPVGKQYVGGGADVVSVPWP